MGQEKIRYGNKNNKLEFETKIKQIQQVHNKQSEQYNQFKGKYKKMFEDFKMIVEQNAEMTVTKDELEEKVKNMNKQMSKLED